MGAADEAREREAGEIEVEDELHRSKERRERHRREERDHHGSGRRDRDREKEKEERRRERDGSIHRDKDREREREKDREKEEERRRERDDSRHRDRDRDRDSKHKERESERERGRDRGKDRERETEREREKERDRRDREKERSRTRDKEKERERPDRERHREKSKERGEREREKSREREDVDGEKSRGRDREESHMDLVKGAEEAEKPKADAGRDVESSSASELRERLTKMKEQRLKEKNEEILKEKNDDASEVLSWVGKSRKLEEKRNLEREKALRRARELEEQDNILAESVSDEEDEKDKQDGDHLAGVKVLHGLDRVMEGGAIVLTLKDQSILAGGDINEEADMLENIEIDEQKKRDQSYKAAKKIGTYDDKFNDDPLSKKPILPHYDDQMEDEGVTLDQGGHFTGEAEKKLEELRKRIEGGYVQKKTEDLTSTTKKLTDYYTPDEMLQFKKPKKKKSLRKKEKLDLDALEAEAIAAGLGAGDLGSRKDGRRQAAREEEQKADAEKRSSAYQAAIAKAEEASKALRQEKSSIAKTAEEEELVFGEDYEDLQKSLEQARRLALRKKEEAAASGPQGVAEFATASKRQEDATAEEGEAEQNKVVITEMEEFVWGLQLNEEARKPEAEDVFMDEDDDTAPSHNEAKDDNTALTEVEDKTNMEESTKDEKEDVKPDDIIHEVAVGKGLSGALKLLQDRGTLNEGIEWGGRTTDKKKSKLVGLEDGPKEIRIERHDEFGRVMTPKEAFRMLSHKFHGKGPGKMKQEKRMKKFQEDLKTKQMKGSDTPLMAVEKMREAQSRMGTPYLVLTGNAKTGQTSDPKSGFGSMDKDHPGSLTPMLGDKKVEHFLGIKRNRESGSMPPPPPPKKPKP